MTWLAICGWLASNQRRFLTPSSSSSFFQLKPLRATEKRLCQKANFPASSSTPKRDPAKPKSSQAEANPMEENFNFSRRKQRKQFARFFRRIIKVDVAVWRPKKSKMVIVVGCRISQIVIGEKIQPRSEEEEQRRRKQQSRWHRLRESRIEIFFADHKT